MTDRKKTLDLDKICRVCISERKDMRPLFSEKIADMLMECTNISVEPTEGWPDQICVQCILSLSRCHAFKTLVERKDKELRDYIKKLTVHVIVEESTSTIVTTAKELKLQQGQMKLLQTLQQQNLQQKQQQLQQQISQRGHRKVLTANRKSLQQQHQNKKSQQHHLDQSQVLHTLPIAVPVVPPSNLLASSTSSVRKALPTTTTIVPKQIMLPNGQMITAQILSRPPQIVQTLSTTPSTTARHTPQHPPHLIQTTKGQTLQIVKHGKGQTLQLVQLMPQQLTSTSGEVALSRDGGDFHVSGIKIELAKENSNDSAPDLDDDHENFETVGESIEDESEDVCEAVNADDEDNVSSTTIRLDEDSLSQNASQEVEYLEDVTVTTTTATATETVPTVYDQIEEQHEYLQDSFGDDEYIIEELHDEDDLIVEDSSQKDEMNLMDSSTVEYLSEEDDMMSHGPEHLMEDSERPIMQFTVIESNDDSDTIIDPDEHEEFQSIEGNGSDLNSNSPNTTMILNQVDGAAATTAEVTPARKRKAATNNISKSSANIQQIALEATSAEEDFDMDENLIAVFISQQTTALTDGRYACNLCNQGFKMFTSLQSHMHQHSNWIRANCKKQPKCDVCFKKFKDPGMLHLHMMTHQPVSRTPLCTFCGKTFKTKGILYRHRLSHRPLPEGSVN